MFSMAMDCNSSISGTRCPRSGESEAMVRMMTAPRVLKWSEDIFLKASATYDMENVQVYRLGLCSTIVVC